MLFFLGVHRPNWLGLTSVPLFVSRRWLAGRKTLPRGTHWALDSGAFTELSMNGSWTVSAMTYSSEVRRFRDEIGGMAWAASQDWMCEPFILAKTRSTVAEHQRRTTANYLLLRQLAPDIPWVPVLQGWEHDEYLGHFEEYRAAGVDLTALPLVGIGSVCRRQDTAPAERIIRELSSLGIRLHAFGFKLQGIRRVGDVLASADSMAWSFSARREPPLPGHTHKSCANCLEYALWWRKKVMRIVDAVSDRKPQPTLFA